MLSYCHSLIKILYFACLAYFSVVELDSALSSRDIRHSAVSAIRQIRFVSIKIKLKLKEDRALFLCWSRPTRFSMDTYLFIFLNEYFFILIKFNLFFSFNFVL